MELANLYCSHLVLQRPNLIIFFLPDSVLRCGSRNLL